MKIVIDEKKYEFEPYPDVYDDENRVTLYNGKCEDLLNKLPDSSLQLIVTSPPYNIGKEYEKVLPIKNYIDWQDSVIDLCIQKLKPEGSICWQVGNTIDMETGEKLPLDVLLFDSFKSRGLYLRNRIIWHFEHGVNDKNRFSGRYETILWFTKSNDYVFNLDSVRVPQKYPGKKGYKGSKKGEFSCNPLGKNPSDFWEFEKETDVWDIPNVKSNHIERIGKHQCQFPVALIQRLVLALSNENDLVYDPFMGLGTTQVASVLNNRRTLGSELSDEYFKIASWRIQEAERGQLPIREDKPVYIPPKNTPLTTNPFIHSVMQR